MISNVLTVRLGEPLKKRLRNLAQSTRRSESFLAVEAIRVYVANNEWQILEIKKAISEADRGEFASDRRVGKVLSKWKRKR